MLLQEAFTFDGTFRLAEDLLIAKVAEDNKHRVINERFQQSAKNEIKKKSSNE